MTRGQKLAQTLDRAFLGVIMATLAFILEKVLDSVVAAEAGERRPSRLGGALVRRVLPGSSASLRHQHQTPPRGT